MISLFLRRLVWAVMVALIWMLMGPFLAFMVFPIASLAAWVDGDPHPFKGGYKYAFDDVSFCGPMPQRMV